MVSTNGGTIIPVMPKMDIPTLAAAPASASGAAVNDTLDRIATTAAMVNHAGGGQTIEVQTPNFVAPPGSNVGGMYAKMVELNNVGRVQGAGDTLGNAPPKTVTAGGRRRKPTRKHKKNERRAKSRRHKRITRRRNRHVWSISSSKKPRVH